jgi:hypothetical protein
MNEDASNNNEEQEDVEEDGTGVFNGPFDFEVVGLKMVSFVVYTFELFDSRYAE